MILDTRYLLFVAMKESRFVIAWKGPSVGWTENVFMHYTKNYVKEFIVSFLPVQKQTDGHNCSPFAMSFAAEALDGKSPVKKHFDVERMREHLINCLENKFLIPFPKISYYLSV